MMTWRAVDCHGEVVDDAVIDVENIYADCARTGAAHLNRARVALPPRSKCDPRWSMRLRVLLVFVPC